jgi:hypothetical protein
MNFILKYKIVFSLYLTNLLFRSNIKEKYLQTNNFKMNEKKLLLDNLNKVCKDYHPSLGFIKPIVKRLIEEYFRTEGKSCQIGIGKLKKKFNAQWEVLIVLSRTLGKIGFPEIEKIDCSSAGIISLNMKNLPKDLSFEEILKNITNEKQLLDLCPQKWVLYCMTGLPFEKFKKVFLKKEESIDFPPRKTRLQTRFFVANAYKN